MLTPEEEENDVVREVVLDSTTTLSVFTNHEPLPARLPLEEDPSQIDDTATAEAHFLESIAGEELTVELDGKLYVISTIQDEETGQLLNVINLASEAVVEDGNGLGRLELEVYTDTSDLLVGINGADVEMDLEVPEPETEYEEDLPHLEEAAYQHISRDQEGADGGQVPGVCLGEKRIGKKQKRKPKNKDATELPFTYAGQTFTIQAQKLILNVFDFFDRTKEDPGALHKIGTPQEQAGKVLNVSPHVIGKVRRRFKTLGKIVVPGERRQKCKKILDGVDAEKELVIRAIIKEFTTKQIPPTVSTVMAEAIRRIGFQGSRTSFRRVLHRMGFKSAKMFKRTAIIDPNPPKTTFTFVAAETT